MNLDLRNGGNQTNQDLSSTTPLIEFFLSAHDDAFNATAQSQTTTIRTSRRPPMLMMEMNWCNHASKGCLRRGCIFLGLILLKINSILDSISIILLNQNYFQFPSWNIHSCSICGGFHWVFCLCFVQFIFCLLFIISFYNFTLVIQKH